MSKLCDQLGDIYIKIDQGDQKDIDKNWKEFFSCYLKDCGFNYTAIEALFEWGSDGHNWSELHIDKTEYKDYNKDQLLQRFICEVHYIYDRMSLDRLFRTHWLYNQWKQAKG